MPTIRPIRTQLGFQPPGTPAVGGGGGGRGAPGVPSPAGAALGPLERIATRYFRKREALAAKRDELKKREADNKLNSRLNDAFASVGTQPEGYTPVDGEPAYVMDNADGEYRKRGLKVIDSLSREYPDQSAFIRETGLRRMKQDEAFLVTLESDRTDFMLDLYRKEDDEGDRQAMQTATETMMETKGNAEQMALSLSGYLDSRKSLKARNETRGIEDHPEVIAQQRSDDSWMAASVLFSEQMGNDQAGADEFRLKLAKGGNEFVEGMTPEEIDTFVEDVDAKLEILHDNRLGVLAENKAADAAELADFELHRAARFANGQSLEDDAAKVADLAARGIITTDDVQTYLEEGPKIQAESIQRNRNRDALVEQGRDPDAVEVALTLSDGNLDKAEDLLAANNTDGRYVGDMTKARKDLRDRIAAGLRDPGEIRSIGESTGLPEGTIRDNIAFAEDLTEEESAFANEPWVQRTVVASQKPGNFGMENIVLAIPNASVRYHAAVRAIYPYAKVLADDPTIPVHEKESLLRSKFQQSVQNILGTYHNYAKSTPERKFTEIFTSVLRNDPRVRDVFNTYVKRENVGFDLNDLTIENYDDRLQMVEKSIADDIREATGAEKVRFSLDLKDIRDARTAMKREESLFRQALLTTGGSE